MGASVPVAAPAVVAVGAAVVGAAARVGRAGGSPVVAGGEHHRQGRASPSWSSRRRVRRMSESVGIVSWSASLQGVGTGLRGDGEERVVAVKAAVFDLGGVLIDWDPRYLYQKLLADEEVEEFLATVCTPEWNAEQDRGRPFAEGVAELVERHPAHAAAIAAYHERWPEMLGGDIPGAVELLAELRATGLPLYALTNWSAETFVVARERFAFLDWFDGLLVSGERISQARPGHLRAAAGRFGLDPGRPSTSTTRRPTWPPPPPSASTRSGSPVPGSCDGTWQLGDCSLDPLPLPGHRPEPVVHDLGHGELAGGRPGPGAVDDPGGEREVLAVQRHLGPGQLGDVLGSACWLKNSLSRPRLELGGSSVGSASQAARAARPRR